MGNFVGREQSGGILTLPRPTKENNIFSNKVKYEHQNGKNRK